jgi:hypothetical protein
MNKYLKNAGLKERQKVISLTGAPTYLCLVLASM